MTLSTSLLNFQKSLIDYVYIMIGVRTKVHMYNLKWIVNTIHTYGLCVKKKQHSVAMFYTAVKTTNNKEFVRKCKRNGQEVWQENILLGCEYWNSI